MGIRSANLKRRAPAAVLMSGQFHPGPGFAPAALVHVEADGDAVAGISSVVQIISIVVVVQVHVIAVILIV